MKILLALVFMLSMSRIFACLAADQNRLFPIGMSSSGLVVVEIHLHRGEKTTKTHEMVPSWGGTGYLNVYDKNYKCVSSEALGEFSGKTNYEEAIRQIFKKGWKRVKKIDGFVYVEPLSLSFCDYLQDCSKAQFSYDSIAQQPFVMLDNRPYKIPVLFDSTSIASNYVRYVGSFESEDNGYMQNLGINSVRKFQLGDRVITIVHLGCGQHDADAKEYVANFEFIKLEESTFYEPVLHHGHGFDFFIID